VDSDQPRTARTRRGLSQECCQRSPNDAGYQVGRTDQIIEPTFEIFDHYGDVCIYIVSVSSREVWAYDPWQEHVDAINAKGLRLSGAGDVVGKVTATTDPAAVVAIFRELGAPARLTRLVAGEAVLDTTTASVTVTSSRPTAASVARSASVTGGR
jgi:hypothetical protein